MVGIHGRGRFPANPVECAGTVYRPAIWQSGDMDGLRWGVAPTRELGAVVHGPVVLGRVGDETAVDGVAVGLRCVVAHPAGLRLTLIVVADGVYGDAAWRQREGYGARPARRGDRAPAAGGRSRAGDDLDGWADDGVGSSELSLVVELDGRAITVWSQGESSSAGPERYEQETVYWIEPLPSDETIRLTVAWPKIGLAPTTTTLHLPGLAAAAATTITLLPEPVSGPDQPGG